MNRIFVFLLMPWLLGAIAVALMLAQLYFGIDLVPYFVCFGIAAMVVLGFNVVVGIWPSGEL